VSLQIISAGVSRPEPGRPGSELTQLTSTPAHVLAMRHAHSALAVFVLVMLAATAGFRLARPTDRAALPPARTGQRIDVNAADADTLQLLPGIGPNLARRIVEHRQSAGPFATVNALQDVKGIGPKTVERLRPHVTCGAL
jgi:competence ComEA-like helix-hairpin-helix protein